MEAAEGRLVDAEITGTDAAMTSRGSQTERSSRRGRDGRGSTRNSRAATRPRPNAPSCQRQRADAGEQVAAARTGAAEQRASLATTPMTFDYESGPAIRGFDTQRSAHERARTSCMRSAQS